MRRLWRLLVALWGPRRHPAPRCDWCEAEAQAFAHPYDGCRCGRDDGPPA